MSCSRQRRLVRARLHRNAALPLLALLCSYSNLQFATFGRLVSKSFKLRHRVAPKRIALHAVGDDSTEEDESLRTSRERLSRSWDADFSSVAATPDMGRAARDVTDVTPGTVLLGNPKEFIDTASRAGAGRMGPIGGGLTPIATIFFKVASLFGVNALNVFADGFFGKKTRLLPVVLVTDRKPDGSAEGVALTTRTGQLLGDFQNIGAFMTRPLYWGGPEQSSLTMVHPYSQVPQAKSLGATNLYVGGDLDGARDWVEDGQGSSLRFRFFVRKVKWSAGELDNELAAKKWFPVECTSECVLDESSEDNSGKPLWAELATLAEGEALQAGRKSGVMD